MYLSSRIVKNIDHAAVVDSPVYEPAKNVALVRSTPKQGTISPGAKNIVYGPMALDGRTGISLLDPKLGKVSFRMVITRITPQTYECKGVEYDWTLSHPVSHIPSPFWKQLVFREVDFKDAQSMVKAIGFFTQSGDDVAVRKILAALEKASPKAAAEQRRAVAADVVEKTLQQVERLESRGLHRKAGLLIKTLAASADAQLVDADLGERLKAEAAKYAEIFRAFADAKRVLADVGLGDTKLSLAQARRVIKAAAIGAKGSQKLTEQDMQAVLRLGALPPGT